MSPYGHNVLLKHSGGALRPQTGRGEGSTGEFSQISHKESGSKWKSNTQQEYVWH